MLYEQYEISGWLLQEEFPGELLSKTPCLLTTIAVIFIGCIWHPTGEYGIPAGAYGTNHVIKGFLEGYLTMDTIAALNFGIIISLNMKDMGVTEESSVVKETIKAGFIAGILILTVYSALAHIGGLTGDSYVQMENGAQTLTIVVRFLFEKTGMVLLAHILFIACLNTCVGLAQLPAVSCVLHANERFK